MKKSNFFGFWAEHCGNGFPAFAEQPKNVLSESEAELVATYLENYPIWVASPGIVYSPVDGCIAGSMSIKTDGEWAWQDTMAYYVRKYHVSPSLEFIQHIQRKSYISPSEREIDVAQLDFPEKF
jgi:murein endopeptidase